LPEDIYVPKRFEDEVLVHAYVAGAAESGVPLILGIQGPPGDGKSFQCRVVAKRRMLRMSSIHAAELAHKYEGEPVGLLRQAYVSLAAELSAQDLAGFLIIDDFDMGVAGVKTGRTYTVNTQLLTSFLMSLCDDPLLKGQLRRPAPIIVTGNDLGCLYGPLRRQGRMAFFEWEPTRDERSEIVSRVLELQSREQALQRVLERFDGMPVSFFGQVASEMKRRLALKVIREQRGPILYSLFWTLFRESRGTFDTLGRPHDLVEEILAIGDRLKLAQSLRSHFGSEDAGERAMSAEGGR
jgi:hypothetical protein